MSVGYQVKQNLKSGDMAVLDIKFESSFGKKVRN